MNFPTQIERDLFDYLSPDKQADVEQCLADLEADPDIDEEEIADNAVELMIRPTSMLEPYDYKGDR